MVLRMQKIEQAGVLEPCALKLIELGDKSSTTEALAQDTVNFLYNQLSEGEDDPCALIRFFRTIPYQDLTAHLKKTVNEILTEQPSPNTNCLTLLASRGSEKEWNDRFQSRNHQVIPLTSSKIVEAAPMVAQLIKRLGIDIAQVVTPSPGLFLNPKQKSYHVMYIPEALNDPSIVAQDEFVVPQKIRTVIGFGGLLPSGDMFAVLCFMRVFIAAKTAARFGLLAQGLEEAIIHLPREKHNRARILLADEEHTADRLLKVLGQHHEIVEVSTLAAAKNALNNGHFDMIVCGTKFDESRMFDFLRHTKQDKSLKPKPFICLRQSTRNAHLESTAPLAAKLIGATCYLDAVQMSDQDLAIAIDAYLPKDIWMGE